MSLSPSLQANLGLISGLLVAAIFLLAKHQPKRLAASFLAGSWYLGSTLTSVLSEFSTATDDNLTLLLRVAFVYAAVTLFFGPFLVLTPTSPIVLEKETLFKSLVKGAQAEKTRRVATGIFWFLTAMQGFVVFSLYQVLTILKADVQVIIGMCVGYSLICLIFLCLFYSVMMKKDLVIKGVNLMQTIRQSMLIYPKMILSKIPLVKVGKKAKNQSESIGDEPAEDEKDEPLDILAQQWYTKFYIFMFVVVFGVNGYVIISTLVQDSKGFDSLDTIGQLIVVFGTILNLLMVIVLTLFILNVAFNPVNTSSEAVVDGMVVKIGSIFFTGIYDRISRNPIAEWNNIFVKDISSLNRIIVEYVESAPNTPGYSFSRFLGPLGTLYHFNDPSHMYISVNARSLSPELSFYFLYNVNSYVGQLFTEISSTASVERLIAPVLSAMATSFSNEANHKQFTIAASKYAQTLGTSYNAAQEADALFPLQSWVSTQQVMLKESFQPSVFDTLLSNQYVYFTTQEIIEEIPKPKLSRTQKSGPPLKSGKKGGRRGGRGGKRTREKNRFKKPRKRQVDHTVNLLGDSDGMSLPEGIQFSGPPPSMTRDSEVLDESLPSSSVLEDKVSEISILEESVEAPTATPMKDILMKDDIAEEEEQQKKPSKKKKKKMKSKAKIKSKPKMRKHKREMKKSYEKRPILSIQSRQARRISSSASDEDESSGTDDFAGDIAFPAYILQSGPLHVNPAISSNQALLQQIKADSQFSHLSAGLGPFCEKSGDFNAPMIPWSTCKPESLVTGQEMVWESSKPGFLVQKSRTNWSLTNFSKNQMPLVLKSVIPSTISDSQFVIVECSVVDVSQSLKNRGFIDFIISDSNSSQFGLIHREISLSKGVFAHAQLKNRNGYSGAIPNFNLETGSTYTILISSHFVSYAYNGVYIGSIHPTSFPKECIIQFGQLASNPPINSNIEIVTSLNPKSAFRFGLAAFGPLSRPIGLFGLKPSFYAVKDTPSENPNAFFESIAHRMSEMNYSFSGSFPVSSRLGDLDNQHGSLFKKNQKILNDLFRISLKPLKFLTSGNPTVLGEDLILKTFSNSHSFLGGNILDVETVTKSLGNMSCLLTSRSARLVYRLRVREQCAVLKSRVLTTGWLCGLGFIGTHAPDYLLLQNSINKPNGNPETMYNFNLPFDIALNSFGKSFASQSSFLKENISNCDSHYYIFLTLGRMMLGITFLWIETVDTLVKFPTASQAYYSLENLHVDFVSGKGDSSGTTERPASFSKLLSNSASKGFCGTENESVDIRANAKKYYEQLPLSKQLGKYRTTLNLIPSYYISSAVGESSLKESQRRLIQTNLETCKNFLTESIDRLSKILDQLKVFTNVG